MKNVVLKIIAKIAERSIKISNNTACVGWTYQPKMPNGIENFKK